MRAGAAVASRGLLGPSKYYYYSSTSSAASSFLRNGHWLNDIVNGIFLVAIDRSPFSSC